jgi:hypothetical protein
MAFLEEGGGSLAMAWVLSGSIIIPSLDTINPSSLPLYCKDRFLRVERYVKLAASFQDSPKVRQMIFLVFRKDSDIIKIDTTDWLRGHIKKYPLLSGKWHHIYQSKRHFPVGVSAPWGTKVVLSWSEGDIRTWLYPKKPSNKDSLSKPDTLL